MVRHVPPSFLLGEATAVVVAFYFRVPSRAGGSEENVCRLYRVNIQGLFGIIAFGEELAT